MMERLSMLVILLIVLAGQGAFLGSLGSFLQSNSEIISILGWQKSHVQKIDWKEINRQVREEEGPRSTVFPLWAYASHVQDPENLEVGVESGEVSVGRPYVWLRVKGFYRRTCQQIRQGLKPGSMTVLDLRGNRGGLVSVAHCVMELFVPRGTKLWSYRDYQTGESVRVFLAARRMLSADPLVVLVDGQTASVAEVMAGSLGELKRAEIVGRRTQGKGTVQVGYMDSRWRGSVHYQTRYLFVLPSGKGFQFQGWQPSVLVEGFSLRGKGEREAYREHAQLAEKLSEWNDGKKSNLSKSSSCTVTSYDKTQPYMLEGLLKSVLDCQNKKGEG